MRRRSVLLLGAVALLLASLTLASGEPVGCYVDRETIYIYGNDEFCFANGVVAGCGSAESPYIIEGWRIVATGVDAGIRIDRTTAHFIIRDCVVIGGSGAAIRLNSLSDGSIQGCYVSNAERGILLENTSRVAVLGNVISENRRGAVMSLGAWGNIFSGNSFIANGKNAEDPHAENQWFWDGAGNYWSDYAGTDCNGNGIGDCAYEPVADAYPLMGPPGSCPTTLSPAGASLGACGLAGHASDCGMAVATPCHASAKTIMPCNPADVCNQVPACMPAQPCGVCDTCAASSPCATASPLAAGGMCQPACPPSTGCTVAHVCNPCVTPCDDKILDCTQTAVTLTADVVPGHPSCAPCSIRWTNSRGEIVGTERNIAVTEPGVYTITITGADGCSASDSVAVYQDVGMPSIQTSVGGMLSCNVTEVSLAALISGGRAPYDITWIGPGGQNLGRKETAAACMPGTYTVTVAGANGCSSSATALVQEDRSQPVVQASVDGILTCENTSVTLSANVTSGQPPYTYTWSKPGIDLVGTGPTIVVGEAGAYTVSVRGANGCEGTATVSVTNDAIAPSVNVSGGGTLTCSVTSVPLTASVSGGRAPYEILWMLPGHGVVGEGMTYQATEPGTYTATATGANGCWTSAQIVVVQNVAEPSVDAGADQMLTLETRQVTLTATAPNCPGCLFGWTDPLGEPAGNTASITADKPGIYTVTATNPSTGCVASDEVKVGADRVSEVMLKSTIHGLAVFGQLLKDGVPIPGTTFSFQVGDDVSPETGPDFSAVMMTASNASGVDANGAEVSYIIPTNATVRFTIHKDQFILGKQYMLLHLPTDPEGDAAISFL